MVYFYGMAHVMYVNTKHSYNSIIDWSVALDSIDLSESLINSSRVHSLRE